MTETPFIYSREIRRRGHWDVVVVGAGSAGSSAAIAAARAGCRTLLIDTLPFLGGTSTAVLDTFYGYYTPGQNARRIVGGIPDDVVAGLEAHDACFERPNTHGAGTGITYHPEYLKVVWERLAQEAGVDCLLHSRVVDTMRGADGALTSLVLATKAGLEAVEARYFIDASGDADICAQAGFDFELAGAVDPAQTLTTTFKMVNVDIARRKAINKAEVFRLMAEAAESGAYDLPRREGSDHVTPVDHMTATIMTRLESFRTMDNGTVVNATDPDLLTQAEIAGRRQALEYVRFLRDKVPGYERAALSTFGTQIGVRETRRVYGEYRLTREDVLSARKFDDQIGLCGAPIEDHHGGTDTRWAYLPEGETVGIPYRTLVPRGSQNLLVAGRCFSATHDAHASVRSMGQTMSLGQAAGVAAAIAVAADASVSGLDANLLRDRLTATGAIVEP